jgi:dihydroorotase-like cyclic amidohydrolase
MKIIKLPGLIDPHVHFRTPGQSQKEDFSTGTKAALAGGFTTVLDMPNNATPITTSKLLKEKQSLAKKGIYCDIGFHFGSLGNNFEEFKAVKDKVMALKIYLNQTTGGFIVDDKVFTQICKFWPKGRPIIVHAEEDVIGKILKIGAQTKQKIHVAHVSSKKELQTIIKMKKSLPAGRQVTCGVTPHHLFLTDKDAKRLGGFGKMKPYLKNQQDIDFLWKNIKFIDLIETDHAPHTLKEKISDNPPFGVPGLETSLPLMLTAVNAGKLTIKDVKRLLHDGPAKVFKIKSDPRTFIEVDLDEEWVVLGKKLFTKCKWSPFEGFKMRGRVKKVVLRGKTVFENGRILSKPLGRVV